MRLRPWRAALLGLVASSSLFTTIVCDVPQSFPGIIIVDRDDDWDWDDWDDWDDDDFDFFDFWFWW